MPSCQSDPASSDTIAYPADADTPTPASLAAALYVVATPIGNLEDISTRAIRTLRAVSWIAAEDTRSSRPLLHSLGISAGRCLSLHAHNEITHTNRVLARIRQGEAIALISDAGTPGISDPGAHLIASAHAAGIPVVPIPGPSATTTLISAAGLPGGRFFFEGFLPTRKRQRQERLATLASAGNPFLLFEAPHRIEALASDLQALLESDRPVVVGRELTKRFEQIVRMPLGSLSGWLAADSNHRRGEFALLVFGPPPGQPHDGPDDGAASPSATGIRAMQVLGAEMPPRQAARLAAQISGDSADSLYKLQFNQATKNK